MHRISRLSILLRAKGYASQTTSHTGAVFIAANFQFSRGNFLNVNLRKFAETVEHAALSSQTVEILYCFPLGNILLLLYLPPHYCCRTAYIYPSSYGFSRKHLHKLEIISICLRYIASSNFLQRAWHEARLIRLYSSF